MDKVLVQKQVYTLLNDHYVAVKINLDSEKKLGRKYRVTGIPAIMVLDSRGALLKRISGYVPADSLSATLKSLR